MSVLSRLLVLSVACLSVFTVLPCAYADNAPPHYTVTDTLPLPGSVRWDYLTFDATNHRLFITRGDSVDILDVNSKKIINTIPNLNGVHGVALAPELNKGFITEGKANRVTIFDLTTYKILGTIATGNKPDAIAYDKTTRLVFAANGESNSLTVIDAQGDKAVATIQLGGQPEFMALNSKQRLYVNLEDKSKIAIVNTKSLKLLTSNDLTPGCDGPTGLAIDQSSNHLFSVCANKNMQIVDGWTGKVVDTLPIGQHSDAAGFDPDTGLAFSSNGDGTLTVVGSTDGKHYKVLQTVQTKATARTMAIDPTTHKIYLASADTDGFDPPTAQHPEPRPHVKPDSFAILTVSPVQ